MLASAVERIDGCFKVDEFGPPEGMWVLRVGDLPTVVTMDSHGRSLHDEVEEASRRRLETFLDIS